VTWSNATSCNTSHLKTSVNGPKYLSWKPSVKELVWKSSDSNASRSSLAVAGSRMSYSRLHGDTSVSHILRLKCVYPLHVRFEVFTAVTMIVTANVVPSSPILVTLMMEALSSSETSVL
jgi:hypothetical protein